MKPCKTCGLPKNHHKGTYVHGWYSKRDHEFEMDNLLWVENQLKKREREEKHKRLNFCQICKQNKKSPFGICKECSDRLIEEKKNDTLV
jgi:hypothetical protein